MFINWPLIKSMSILLCSHMFFMFSRYLLIKTQWQNLDMVLLWYFYIDFDFYYYSTNNTYIECGSLHEEHCLNMERLSNNMTMGYGKQIQNMWYNLFQTTIFVIIHLPISTVLFIIFFVNLKVEKLLPKLKSNKLS